MTTSSCPTTPAELETGGDTDTRDMAQLGELMEPKREFTFAELAEFCGEHGLFDRFTEKLEDERKAQGARSAFGKVLGSHSGRFAGEGVMFLSRRKPRCAT